jgi:hypothetical protein
MELDEDELLEQVKGNKELVLDDKEQSDQEEPDLAAMGESEFE